MPLTVDEFLDALLHNRKDEIRALRKAIITLDENITETIKWNAPNFCWKGHDRVTLRLHPGDRLEIILHRGAKKKEYLPVILNDSENLIFWITPDRGVIKISDHYMLNENLPQILKMILEWMQKTEHSHEAFE